MSGFAGAHDGRVALVTGAAGGLGRTYAERLARDGARVVVADLVAGTETGAAIAAAGGEALVLECDVTAPAAVEELRAAIGERFGTVDILVNNAGIAPLTGWDDLDLDLWRRVFSVNVEAMFITCKAFAPGMRESGWGRIVNISSNTVEFSAPGFVHYMASKSAVIGMTRGLATELGGDGVTANCVMPGVTRTPATEDFFDGSPAIDHVIAQQAIKRPAMPVDIEGAVSFLATDDAGWITGQTLVVDGGHVHR